MLCIRRVRLVLRARRVGVRGVGVVGEQPLARFARPLRVPRPAFRLELRDGSVVRPRPGAILLGQDDRAGGHGFVVPRGALAEVGSRQCTAHGGLGGGGHLEIGHVEVLGGLLHGFQELGAVHEALRGVAVAGAQDQLVDLRRDVGHQRAGGGDGAVDARHGRLDGRAALERRAPGE